MTKSRVNLLNTQSRGEDHDYENDNYYWRTLAFLDRFHLLDNDRNVKKNIVAFLGLLQFCSNGASAARPFLPW